MTRSIVTCLLEGDTEKKSTDKRRCDCKVGQSESFYLEKSKGETNGSFTGDESDALLSLTVSTALLDD